MAYRVAGMPDRLNSSVFDALLTSPEKVQANPPVPQKDSLARLLGLIGSRPPSAEAMGAMNPSEMEAVTAGTEKGGTQRLLSILALLGSLIAPPLMVPSMALAGMSKGTEANVEDILTGAEKRARERELQKNFLSQEMRLKEGQQEETESRNRMTVLQRMVSGVDQPGFMSEGEARGKGAEAQRIAAEASRDKASLAHEKMLVDWQKTASPLFAKAMAGKATPEEIARLQWGAAMIRESRQPVPGFMGQPLQPGPMPEYPFPEKSPKPVAKGLSEKEARKMLEAKGIKGKEADAWILKYRKAGKVK